MRQCSKLGNSRQLFIDGWIVEETRNLRRTLNQPRQVCRAIPLMFPLYPWEGRLELYGTVWREAETGRFRMWLYGIGEHGCHPNG